MITFIYALYGVLLIAVIVWSLRKVTRRPVLRRPFHELSEAEQWAERAERMFDRRS